MLLEREQLKKEASVDNICHKSYLIILKYIPHITAFLYMIYTLFQFLDIDLIILGYFIHTSIVSWLFMMLSSIVFKFCYVHRLPLYYIMLNDASSVFDHYIGIPVTDKTLFGIHIILIGLLMFGYTYYYKKCKR